jgi:hypothetical protein
VVKRKSLMRGGSLLARMRKPSSSRTKKSKFNFEHLDSFCYVLMFSLLCITDWHTNVLIIVQQLDI